MPTLYQIILVALGTTFIIIFLTKTLLRDKLRDFFDNHKLNILAELVECDFCFGFWAAFVISIILAIFSQDSRCLFIPLFASPLIRFWL